MVKPYPRMHLTVVVVDPGPRRGAGGRLVAAVAWTRSEKSEGLAIMATTTAANRPGSEHSYHN